MNTEDFENQLRRHPMRTLPPGWREPILREARRQADQPATSSATQPSRAGWSRWREWLWPSPRAWAGLAATWVGIALLNLGQFSHPRLLAKHGAPPPADAATIVAAQRRELVRLLDASPESSPAPTSRPPGPRGEIVSPPRA